MPEKSSGLISKTALIHIGTAKTGTTSIQRCLAQAQANGNLGPICYPLWKNDVNQQRLALIYPPGEIWSAWMRQFLPTTSRRFRRMRDQYRQFLFESLRSCHGAILSAEMLNSFSRQRVETLRDDLQELGFQEFHVILYVRDPADLYLSNTAQLLRGPAVPPLIEDPALFRYEFLQAADTWGEVFPGKLIVRGLPIAPDFDVVDDFADLVKRYLGIDLPRVPMRANTTISAEAMKILDDYRRTYWPDNGGLLTPDTSRLVQFLQGSRQRIPQTTPVLKHDVAKQIRANHRADAEMLYARHGVDLGLRDSDQKAVAPRRESYRVDEIVESVDPDVVHRLMLHLARAELSGRQRERPLPLRVAARAYRRVPARLRPAGLDATLRRRFAASE